MVADVVEVSGCDDRGWNTSKSTVIFPIPHTNFFTNNSRHYYSYIASKIKNQQKKPNWVEKRNTTKRSWMTAAIEALLNKKEEVSPPMVVGGE
ncbi:hypothetical protein MTR_5g084550 [Medicago truncatula]|uniref:Uncharacterized protein n=1 Tax=Medicago truncatula TaxID=3880 RepID=G7K7E1_MEDTR|nr:hypothetical protein MTR_5g084550 [Medicago truncatula]